MRTPLSNRAVDLVPNERIREAVLASGQSVTAIAAAINRDERMLKRSLGLAPRSRSRGHQYPPQARINYHLAVDVARAIGLDPVDVDL